MRAPSKKLRFEVFKRDSFTCQYCGRKAPDVILECDHLEPFAEGGETTILNLVTSCQECNAGKGDRRLSDDAAVQRQHAQAELLQQRREQIEMMADWQRSLSDARDQALTIAAEVFSRETGYALNARGLETVRKSLVRFGLEEVCEAIRIARSQYVTFDPEDKAIHASVELALQKVGGICSVRHDSVIKPYLQAMLKIRAVVVGRFGPAKPWIIKDLLEKACAHSGANLSEIMQIARTARWLAEWETEMKDYIAELAA